MTAWEYKVVPAPTKGRKARGIKGPEGRFAHGLELLMNEMAAEGWAFQRSETLPSEERSGLTSSSRTFRSVLVFRRARAEDGDAVLAGVVHEPDVADAAEHQDQPATDHAEADPEDSPETAQIQPDAADQDADKPAN